jgi:GntP family gluconate:H+ symporter
MEAAGLFTAFVVVLALVSFVSHRYRVSPFFALIGGALLFGLLSGLGIDRTVEGIVSGVGRVFSSFGIIIFSGVVIAKVLEAEGGVDAIVSDVRHRVRDPVSASGLLGYLLAVPVTCCITAYVMLVPILSALCPKGERRTRLLYLAALGSVVSYALIYPTPVVIPLVEAFLKAEGVVLYDAIAIPLSFLLLVLLIALARLRGSRLEMDSSEPCAAVAGPRIHPRAWAPFLAILAATAIGLVAGISHVALINLVMLAGAVTALGLAAPDRRHPAVVSAARHAGIIIFDLVAAGAIGSVIVMSGIAEAVLAAMAGTVPVLLIPFLIAALIQTIQGSRVVTAVISARILAGTEAVAMIDPVPLVLMIGAGACIFSYVTDPYFWLVQRTTEDPPSVVVREYTLPLAAIGVLILGAALLVQVLL